MPLTVFARINFGLNSLFSIEYLLAISNKSCPLQGKVFTPNELILFAKPSELTPVKSKADPNPCQLLQSIITVKLLSLFLTEKLRASQHEPSCHSPSPQKQYT